ECRQSLGQRNVVVPTGNDRDACRSAPNRQLSLPPSNITPCAGQTLSASAFAESADAPDHRRLEGGRVIPASGRDVTRRRLERFPKTQAGVAHGNHYDPAAKAPRPVVALNGHPTALSGVLDDVLAHLRERHRAATAA